jgi:hypothetical protein
MRINLNFKDAKIERMNESEFKIEFDLSKMIKPRLSQDARMYIEHFNLPEFIDEKFGRDKGDLRGYFELRTDNMDSNDFDSEYGNTGNTILYTSPLTNFGTFTNNDPMHISNFKISQNFLRDKLVFILKVFDRNGDPFTLSVTVEEEIVHDVHHAHYKTNINQLLVLQKELEDANLQLNVFVQRLQTQKSAEAVALNLFHQKRDKLFLEINKILNDGRYQVNAKFKSEALKLLLQTETINLFTYLFEEFLPSRKGQSPYNIIEFDLKYFYEYWVFYKDSELKVRDTQTKIGNMNSINTNIWYDNTIEYQPNTINVKSESLKNIDYTTAGGKIGKIDLDTYNSVEQKTTNISIVDITPDSGTANDLVVGDVLTIDNSNFNSVIPEKFEYYFVKSSSQAIPSVSLNNNANSSRFSLKVVRDGNSYTHEFLTDIEAKGVAVGDQITIKGSALGGTDTTNDLVIEIDAKYVPPLTEKYEFNDYKDVNHTDNGTIDIEIERDNSSLDYTETSKDLTKTQNFNIGDKITIDGSRVGGDSKTHDVSIEVKDVIMAETPYTVDDAKITQSIPKVTVDKNNSSPTDSSGTEKASAKDYQFEVFSENETYKLDFDSTKDASEGFVVGDLITISGTVLSGEDVTNDLIIEVTAVTNGKIDSIQVESSGSYVARTAYLFKFEVIVRANDTNYDIKPVTSTTTRSRRFFEVGDVLKVSGDKLGGVVGTHDLEFEITELVKDTNEVENIKIISGTALPETGNIGQIKLVDITGTAKKDPDDGRFQTANTSKKSGTPIDITTVTLPDLKITLEKVEKKGITLIENEITSKYGDIASAKSSLNSIKTKYYLDLNTMQDKFKCFNMSLVLYDEIPEYSQSSKDAIVGNTYSRINGCQFKRI